MVRAMTRLSLVPILGVLAACGGVSRVAPDLPGPADPAKALEQKIAQFAPATLTADVSGLPASERTALALIIEASRELDAVFERQVWVGNPALKKALKSDASALGKARAAYHSIMRGPWDRQDHHKPFTGDVPYQKGAGFYPADMTEEEFQAYVAAHPKEKAQLESLVTLVVRDGPELKAVPYSKAYAEWLEPAAKKLEAAADATQDKTLATFLRARAAAFRSDDYYESDKAWMDLDSVVEVTIGPYETYEDKLLGLKGSFESFVTVADPAASKKLAHYKSLLPDMEKNLPVQDNVKTVRGAESPIRVVDLVYSAGDARKSVQTIAFNLPNDERVRKEKGAKKVLLRNLIETKFNLIMRPIAETVLDQSQLGDLSSEAFFNQVLFHELSHSLGPAFVRNDGKTEVRARLGASYTPLEEAKADVMGAYNILYMVERGEFPKEFRRKLLTSYFAGLWRSVRFGVAESHGRGAALQINRFLEEGGAVFDKTTKRFRVDLDKLEGAIERLVTDICMLQHNGSRGAVDALLGKYAVVSPPMEAALENLGDIPVDIRPRYPLANE